MAKFPAELFTPTDAPNGAKEHIGKFYERLLGISRWFRIGVNGIIYPQDREEPRFDAGYIAVLIDGQTGIGRERLEQFLAQFHELLTEHEHAFDGTLELFTDEDSPDAWHMVKLARARRPFWKWY